jgi:hypothetical protein
MRQRKVIGIYCLCLEHYRPTKYISRSRTHWKLFIDFFFFFLFLYIRCFPGACPLRSLPFWLPTACVFGSELLLLTRPSYFPPSPGVTSTKPPPRQCSWIFKSSRLEKKNLCDVNDKSCMVYAILSKRFSLLTWQRMKIFQVYRLCKRE